jgi:hypothetical protein
LPLNKEIPMFSDLSGVKVGDEIIIHHAYGVCLVKPVTKVTKTMVRVGDLRFRMGGDLVGGSLWTRTWAEIATPEKLEIIKRDDAVNRVRSRIENLRKETGTICEKNYKEVSDLLDKLVAVTQIDKRS